MKAIDRLQAMKWFRVPDDSLHKPSEWFDINEDDEKNDFEQVREHMVVWVDSQAEKALLGITLTDNHIVRVFHPMDLRRRDNQYGFAWVFDVCDQSSAGEEE